MTVPEASAVPADLQLVADGMDGIARLARDGERRAFGRLWAPELHRSSTIPLAVAAAATERIEIATGVALGFTRSPMALALEALDLDELSGGRLVLGLGAGVRRLNADWHSVLYDPPVPRMRETVAAVRELIAALAEGRDARSPGRHVATVVSGLRRGVIQPRPRIPVWLAAVRPRMAALAGEIADGLLEHPVTTARWREAELRPALERGAARAGRAAPPVSAAIICAASAEDPAGARRAAAATVGFYATVRTYEPLFSLHGFGDRLAGIRRAFALGDADRLADAVGDEMTDAFAAAGHPDEVRRRAEDHARGCARLWVTPPHHLLRPGESAVWQAAILDVFGG